MSRITPGFRLAGEFQLVAKGRYDQLLQVLDDGVPRDFSGYTAFQCEIRDTNEDGASLIEPLVSVFIGELPVGWEDQGYPAGTIVTAQDGFLRIEFEAVDAGVLQTSNRTGTIDIFATTGTGEVRTPIANGTWARRKATTDF